MEQEKDILNKDMISKTEQSSVSLLSDTEIAFMNSREKALKVASALHLVTELFSETEPIRSALRTEAVSLITISSTINIFKEAVQNKTFSDVLETINSLITVLHTGNLLSDMNATILLREVRLLMDLGKNIEAQQPHFSEAFLQELFLEPQSTESTVNALDYKKNTVSEIENKRQNLIVTPTSNQGQVSAVLKTKKVVPVSKTFSSHSSLKPTQEKGRLGRKESILNAIGNNGSSIKDIAKAVKGCSEKTIQRELNSLIAKGVIVREGEKRWSVYKKS